MLCWSSSFFYWHFIGLWNPRVDIMTYNLEVTVAKSQACATGADQEDGLQVCSWACPVGVLAR